MKVYIISSVGRDGGSMIHDVFSTESWAQTMCENLNSHQKRYPEDHHGEYYTLEEKEVKEEGET